MHHLLLELTQAPQEDVCILCNVNLVKCFEVTESLLSSHSKTESDNDSRL